MLRIKRAWVDLEDYVIREKKDKEFSDRAGGKIMSDDDEDDG